MYLVDANILVYATDAGARQHDAARHWLDGQLAKGPREQMALLEVRADDRVQAGGFGRGRRSQRE